ncbi:MAG: TMEM165/GDT1 family protein [Clostridiales bacterium]|nr:TMEM165/GDT1 family protein [Clostridiales bacterium]
MLSVYLKALFMIFMAEMGDKTQVLAMTFALKYNIKQILLGVAIGAFLNHGLVILLGTMLTKVLPLNLLQIFAGTLFVFFAFYSLRIEDEEVENTSNKYGVIITVAVAFFIGELGDKTQLTALGLGTSESYPLLVLLGTTSGMVLTSLLGIVIGTKLGKKMPEDKLKMMSFLIFSFFGIEKLYTNLLIKYDLITFFYFFMIIYIIVAIVVIRKFIKKFKILKETSFKKQAQSLFELKNNINKQALKMCRNCSVCDEDICLVGYLKSIIESKEKVESTDESMISTLLNKSFDKEEAKEIQAILRNYYIKYPNEFINNKCLLKVREIANMVIYNNIFENESEDEFLERKQ